MKRIHTKFSTFKTYESKNQPGPKSRILGVFGIGDHQDYLDTVNKIYDTRGIKIPWFNALGKDGKFREDWSFQAFMDYWKYFFRGYRKESILVIYELNLGHISFRNRDDNHTTSISMYSFPEWRPVIDDMVITDSGHALDTTDNLGPGFKSSLGQKNVFSYDNLWSVLSEYSKIRRPGDLTTTDVAQMLLGNETDLTIHGLMLNAKESIEKTRRFCPGIMSALRTVYPEDYQKVFPDGDISADMGDLGF